MPERLTGSTAQHVRRKEARRIGCAAMVRRLIKRRPLLLSGLALLAGCLASIDPGVSQNLAEYKARSLHKALYMNTEDFHMTSSWGQPDSDTAIKAAENACVDGARERHVNPDKCIPAFVDDIQLINLQDYKAARSR